jgi:hypothetical protein
LMPMLHVHAHAPCPFLYAAFPCCCFTLLVKAVCPCCLSILYTHFSCPRLDAAYSCCMNTLHEFAACCMLHDHAAFNAACTYFMSCLISISHCCVSILRKHVRWTWTWIK